MNDDGRSVRGRLIPLTEWIALATFVENQQAAGAHQGQRREAQLAYIGRATSLSLLLVDWLASNLGRAESLDTDDSGNETNKISVEDFAVEINTAADEDVRNSPQVLLDVSTIQCFLSLRNLTLGQVGHVLFQIFSRGKPPLNQVIESSQNTMQTRVRADLSDGFEDEEQPGAEKGRQKRFVGEDTCKAFRRVRISDIDDSLSQLCVPSSISTLLKNLIEPGDDNEGAIHCLDDVSAELRQMVDQPDVFLVWDDKSLTELNFSNIVGRTVETTSLLEAAARTEMGSGGRTNVVMINGDSGSGKSYLVQSVRTALTDNGWICLSCKFDRLMQAQPLSTVASAFEMFFQHIVLLEKEGVDVHDLVSSVQNNLSASGIVVLSELMPSLCTLYPTVFASIIIDEESSQEEESGSNNEILDDIIDEELISSADTSKNRLNYLLRRLIHAISRPNHPLLFFLDDIQWVDESIIQLLSSMVIDIDHLMNADEEGVYTLFVGSYRTDEVDDSHILTTYLNKFEEAVSVNLINIHLGAFTKSDANILVSEALRLPIRQTRGLTDVLYTKTLGNPFFLKALMNSLVDEKVLSFSFVGRRWIWEIEKVRATSIDDDVAVLMTRKLRQLPKDAQKAVTFASCFGSHIDERSLRILQMSDEFPRLIPCLEFASQEGIFVRESGLAYRFAHDMIQLAAYELMPVEEKIECHSAIGKELVAHLASLSSNDFNPIIFTAADQINMAQSLTPATASGDGDLSMHIEFAKLNLRAGERSSEISDFVSALRYLEYGISFLPDTETRWNTNYDLCMSLYESSCLACHINSVPMKMTMYLEEILENAICYDDKLKGLFVLVQSLTASGHIKEAIGKIQIILEELGEPCLGFEVSPTTVGDALMATKKSLACRSCEELISTTRLSDKRLHWAVKLMAFAMPYLFMLKPNHLPIIACRIINILTEHGVCNESVFGLSAYSYCQISFLGDVNEGYHQGKFALSLLESLGSRIDGQKSLFVPKLKILLYHMVFYWAEPIQSTSVALLQCHREALLLGDNEYASFGACFYCGQNIQCGSSLSTVEKECKALALTMIKLNQIPICLIHLSNYQTVLKLIGSNKNPFEVLGGYVNDDDSLLRHAISTGRVSQTLNILFNRLFVHIYFKDYLRAKESSEIAEQYKSQQAPGMKYNNHVFYEGLMAFHFSRCPTEKEGSEPKWMKKGQDALLLFRTWVEYSIWNWENKLLLLEAECHFTLGERKEAEEKFVAAIESARKHRFVHEEGLANDLFSVFLTAEGNIEKAKGHISKARSCYDKWGAHALVELIDLTRKL